ncbi:hypothetical protein Q7P37_001705 [Cladosporium fusiforme]
MIQQRSASLLSSAERQLLRQKRVQNGQCLRCFHTSKVHMAEEGKGNDNGTPYNTPKRGPNRQERAAKVSSELSALAADLPKANLSGRNAEAQGAQPRRPGVSPQSQGKNVGPGRMGENDSPGKEGPFGQPLGRQGPRNKMGDPSIANVMEPLGNVPEAPATSDPNAGTVAAPITTAAPGATTPPTAPAKNLSPKKPAQTPEDLFSSGSGASTLLSSNIPGMIQDRFKLLSPRSTASPATDSEIRHRIRATGNKITAFRTQKEKDAYTKPREKLVAQLAELRKDEEKELAKGASKAPRELVRKIHEIRMQLQEHPKFKPLPKTAQQDIINRMVLGKYDEQGLMSGKEVYKQPLLNTVARELLRNPTYLSKDSEKLLSKLKGLVPAAAAAPAAGKKPAKPAAKATA